MKSIFKNRKFGILIWTFGVVALILLGAQIFVSAYLPNLIRNRITFLVVNGSDSLYRCSMGDISVSLIGGKVSVKDINISIDSTKYKKLEEKGKLPDVSFEAKLSEGAITGLRLLPFLFYKEIRLSTIKAKNADITIYSQYNPEKEKLKKKLQAINEKENIHTEEGLEQISEQKLWQLIEPEIQGIFIDWIFLDHMKFSYKKAGAKNDLKIGYDNLSASLKEIRIDSVGAAEQDRILFTRDLSLSFSGLKIYTEDSLYKLNMDTLIYSSFRRNIFIKGFGVGPTLTPKEFTKKVGQQVDIFDVKIPEINIFNFHIDEIFAENCISLDTVVVQKPLVKIFHDRTASEDTVVKYGDYPNEALMLLPLKLKIPTIILFDSEVHYIEKQAVTYKTGDGFFTHVSGTISNLTNDSLSLANNSHMIVSMEGSFLYSAKMKAGFDFDLLSTNGAYTATADMGHIPTKELNLMTIPFGNMKIKTVDFKHAHFRLKGSTHGATARVRIVYDDLSIELLMKGKKDHKMKKDKFMTFLANLIGVRKNNPSKNGKETIAENIIVKRTAVKPFFTIIWEALFAGMKDIMLLGPAKKIKIGQEQ